MFFRDVFLKTVWGMIVVEFWVHFGICFGADLAILGMILQANFVNMQFWRAKERKHLVKRRGRRQRRRSVGTS